MRFRIEYIDAKQRLIIARQCEAGTPDIPSPENLRLGEVAVRLGFPPRASTPEGTPDETIWAFEARVRSDLATLRVGDVVALSG